MIKIRVATRGSKLSLIQTDIAIKYMKQVLSEAEFEKIVVKTVGDSVLDRPIHEVGIVGVFERDVDKAVADGVADVAVHSLKDIPSRIPYGMEIVFVTPRDSPHDVLIHRSAELLSPYELPVGTVVGTSSLRRKLQILSVNSSISVKPIRGNVDTRIAKLLRGEYDAIVVAECGIKRLGVELNYYRLPLIPFTPPPGQGIIAVTALRDSWIAKALSNRSDRATWTMAVCERTFIETLSAGCSTPLGFVCIYSEPNTITAVANVFPDNDHGIWIQRKSEAGRAEHLGKNVAEEVESLLG